MADKKGEKRVAGTNKAPSFEADGTRIESESSFTYVILSGTTGVKGVSIDRVSGYTEWQRAENNFNVRNNGKKT
jgi:hypothetical protein